jgi:hypothetical protein
LDAITLESNPGGKTPKQKMVKATKEDDLFDIGAEVASIIAPSGRLGLKVARKLTKRKS